MLFFPLRLFSDTVCPSAEDAKQRMYLAAKKARFPIHFGHTSGYQAYIGGIKYSQLPEQKRCAFADGEFEENNSHGRIFGPYCENKIYYKGIERCDDKKGFFC